VTILVTAGYDRLQASVGLCSFQFEMKWTVFYQCLVDRGRHVSYQCCRKVLSTWNTLFLWKKVNWLHINSALMICIAYSSTYIRKFTLNIYCINETNTSSRNVSLFCCRNVNPLEKLVFLLLRLTKLLLAANRKASWNNARISYKRCACPWIIWI